MMIILQGMNAFIESLQPGAQISAYASTNENIQMQTAAVEKELETLEKILAWQLTKVGNKKEVGDRRSKE